MYFLINLLLYKYAKKILIMIATIAPKTDNPIKTNPIPIRSLSNDDINVGITEP